MHKETPKNDPLEMHKEMEICDSFFAFVKDLFNNETEENDLLDVNHTLEMIKEIIKYVRNNHCKLILALHKAELRDENYLLSHTVQTVILSLIIGNDLKLPNHRLIELGVAALLHDIGMRFIPKELYLSSRTLSKEEKKIIQNHPIYGYKFLETQTFSPEIKLAVLDHHEREDGTGYPRKITGKDINLYGKIIAVACSYEAISSERVYKEQRDPHTGMIEILKSKIMYSNEAIHALVNALSVYPVGSYVLLSNEKKAQVVDVDPIDPRFPIVQIIGENSPDSINIFQHTFSHGLYIIGPLSKNEI